MTKDLDIALEYLNKLKNYGSQSYLVGGCARDYVLGVKSFDIDIATNVPLTYFYEHEQLITSNKMFANVAILYKDVKFEITHFRVDEYKDNRFPKIIEVNSIAKDLQRRDFTINCLYMDEFKKIYYPFTSKDDLKNKKIVTVKDPNISFNEDPLRMLRALDYAIKLDFKISKQVEDAIGENFHLLSKISTVRLERQIKKIKQSKNYLSNVYFKKYLENFKKGEL